jgi:hypothetical protein
VLIYSILVKIFPIISIWETREVEPVEAGKEPARHTLKWWQPGKTTLGAIGVLTVLLFSTPASASAETTPRSALKQATIALEWKVLEQPEVTKQKDQQPQPGSISLFSGRLSALFRPFRHRVSEESPSPALELTATLRSPNGVPLSFKPLEFSLKTAFGALMLGSRPTMEDGRAKLVVKDRRFGTYPVILKFAGDKEYSPISYAAMVDFQARPVPSLPNAGVLITPYASPAIALPFLFFYGLMWVVFAYAFGYLIVYRLRRAATLKNPGAAHHRPARQLWDAHLPSRSRAT